MKRFEYLKERIVERRSPDKRRACSLLQRAEQRLRLAETLEPTFSLENAYEAILETLDAELLAAGHRTRSHEAIVARMLDIGFTLTDTVIVDNLRKQRHGIKYYSDGATDEEARAALTIAGKVVGRLAKE